jgi:Myb-like DNA-binding domain
MSTAMASSSPQQNKGPWTEKEKLLFLQGLDMHGRKWTKISEMIGTRSTLQVIWKNQTMESKKKKQQRIIDQQKELRNTKQII